MPKCSMNCTAPALPLATNHICPRCKRPIHAICVGEHVDDAPLGRDIICFDCAEHDEESKALEEEQHQENEVTHVTVSVCGVSYQLNGLQLRQTGEHCSYKKKRGYKCVHDKQTRDEVVTCSNTECSSKSHLVCYLNFLGETVIADCFLFFFTFNA
jgi:hypothetical protein